jgi:type I restriction enzyme S subunit
MEETNKFVQRVTASKLDRRWTPMTFHPKHQRYLDELLGSDFSLWRLTENDAIIDWGDGDHGATEFFDKGVPFIQGQHLKDLIVDFPGTNPVFISIEKHKRLTRSQLTPGDILVVKKGSIGFVSLLPSSISKANTSAEVAFFRFNDKVDSCFLTTYLSSKYGQSSLLRLSYKSTRPTLGLNELDEVFFPYIDRTAQRYIGNKVRQAERLRERSRDLEAKIQNTFSFLTKELKPRKKAWRISGNKVEAYRLNSSHYDAVVLDMLEKAHESTELVRLGSLFGARGISGGATPKGADYSEEGIFFVRVQNVKPLRLDLSDAVYLSTFQDQELERSQCDAQEIILTITGYPGTAAIVLEEDLPVNINQHSVRFDIGDGWEPEYIVAALNSKFVNLQVSRLAIGATRDALDYPSVSSLQIPVLPPEKRKDIAEWVSIANTCIRLTERLTEAAKLLVESLIEGKLSEADLKAAQEDIEQDDTALDREILARLTRKGIDCPKEPPLFPDLDAFYEALSDLDGAETTGDESTNGNGRASNVYPLPNKSLPLASENSSGTYDSTEEVPG